ncbi:MAG: hypothetical protein NVV74_10750 [Magnetospirillum sp.]|nr:hypothetical protein [Magnetospirillum sp.]
MFGITAKSRETLKFSRRHEAVGDFPSGGTGIGEKNPVESEKIRTLIAKVGQLTPTAFEHLSQSRPTESDRRAAISRLVRRIYLLREQGEAAESKQLRTRSWVVQFGISASRMARMR